MIDKLIDEFVRVMLVGFFLFIALGIVAVALAALNYTFNLGW